MAKALSSKKPPAPNRYVGKRIRVIFESEALGHYVSGPTAPERVMVRIDGIITIVPVARLEVLP